MTDRDQERLARVLIERYGLDGFDALLSLFSTDTPANEIARQYEVTRQTVWVWRKAFGERTWTPHVTVKMLLLSGGGRHDGRTQV